jgi:hypothetical protein
MGGACGAHGEMKNWCNRILVGKFEGKIPLEDLDADRMIILK